MPTELPDSAKVLRNDVGKRMATALEAIAQGGGGGASVVQKTMAEYTALPTADKMNGSIYKITDKALIYCLDEEYHAVLEITSADYALLTSDEKNNGTLYIITDEETTAADIPYSTGVSVADKLATIPTDSGWQPITLPSGFTQLSYIGAQARRIGDIVYIELGVETTSVIPTFTVVGTVPTSMKPLIEVNVCGRCMNDIALFSINRNTGAISFLASPSASGAKQFMLCISYPVT